jgi:Protein of unknown function (DUF2442)
MYWDVIEVMPETHLTLQVRFTDGLTGKVRFLPSHLKGVFAPLQQADFFKKVFVEDGVVSWPGEIDLAPDAMHDEIRQHGEWVLK